MAKSLSSNNVAVFDFDNTLVYGDSLWPFLTAVAGWPKAVLALVESLLLLACRYAKNSRDPAVADYRTFIKTHLLRRLLKGKNPNQLSPAIEKLCHWQKWIEPMRAKLLDHHAQGHRIVIASGSLDLYLHELVKDLPQHDLICTQVKIKAGFITGKMLTGNCVRQRKAAMLAEWLAANGPFAESWGYGNFPHDVPMLNLLKHRIIV